MRIAYLIMAHKCPEQLHRLLDRLRHPNFDLYVHLDKKVKLKDFKYLADGVFFIKNRHCCNWGGFSFVVAITTSIKEILKNRVEYDFIKLISAQDYPLKSNQDIYQFYEENKGINFISCEKIEGSSWWKHATSRYEKIHLTDLRFKGRYFLQNLINQFRAKRRFPLSIKIYGGPNCTWWTLDIECVRYIIKFLDNNPKLMRFMKYTWGADEFLYSSIIMNSPFKVSTTNNNFRHIKWEKHSAHPTILTSTHFNELKYSSNLFARKFDINVDRYILDSLDTVNHLR